MGLTPIKVGPLEFKPQEYLIMVLCCIFLETRGLALVAAYCAFKYYSYTQEPHQQEYNRRR